MKIQTDLRTAEHEFLSNSNTINLLKTKSATLLQLHYWKNWHNCSIMVQNKLVNMFTWPHHSTFVENTNYSYTCTVSTPVLSAVTVKGWKLWTATFSTICLKWRLPVSQKTKLLMCTLWKQRQHTGLQPLQQKHWSHFSSDAKLTIIKCQAHTWRETLTPQEETWRSIKTYCNGWFSTNRCPSNNYTATIHSTDSINHGAEAIWTLFIWASWQSFM